MRELFKALPFSWSLHLLFSIILTLSLSSSSSILTVCAFLYKENYAS